VIWSGWVLFFGLIMGAWATLYMMAAGHGAGTELGPGAQWIASFQPTLRSDQASLVSHEHVVHASFPHLIGMWALMCIAMMAPTALPLLRTYWQLSKGNPTRVSKLGFWGLLTGYLGVWCAYSAVAATAQWGLSRLGVLSSVGVSLSVSFTVVLLAAAGAYQFSRLKQACLSRCRSPLTFLLAHWREGVSGAFRMGLRHGALCVGCCWALMALSFVGGTMNLLWMGAAMVLMILEKVPLGRRLTTPLGCALIGAAVAVTIRTLMMF
jgi:predicted metal-binding membrane protein